ncbi:MAG: histidine phosphatase family protein [Planctomycetaceae bacterium]|nr:histidine phosphatase family protein [Planctomycetaceae bacterium]
MSVLTLVRHGQASLFAADYDRLSAVGERQGLALGAYWAGHGVQIDAIYSGPRVRHRKFAELAAAGYRERGLHWPEPVVLNELDEFDLDGMAQHCAPQLSGRDPEFARMVSEFAGCQTDEERQRGFQRMFERVLRHWQASEVLEGDVETWGAFRARVAGVIGRIQSESPRGARVAVFTSGGVIGCALQHALGVSDPMMLDLSWRIRNASLTDFVFTPERLTLDAFNMIPHLKDPALWTYR